MTSLWLGLRLSLTPSARVRTALLVLAAALAGLVLLTTLAASRFELHNATSYQAEMPRIVASVVAAVTLPCLVLLATVARLAASLRDRRLANLRLVGLTPGQTRLVATAETGVAATLGSVLGWLAFWGLRPTLIDHSLGGRHWDLTFAPEPVDQVAVLLAVPLTVALVGLLPTRVTARDPLAVTRRTDRTPPGWWRLVPLVLGAVACAVVVVGDERGPREDTDREIALFLVGTTQLALGLVLVLPALVRLLTRALSGRPLGAASRIAVRRLEAQPAAVARIIGALLIGLFLVTGARYVLVAFESTPQYVEAARGLEEEQRVATDTTADEAPTVVGELERAEGIRDVVDLPMVRSAGETYLEALVATCADLDRVGDVRGCRDGEPMWLGSGAHEGLPETVRWVAGDDESTIVVTTPRDLAAMGNDEPWGLIAPLYADVIIPPALVPDLPATTRHSVLVTGPPGRDLVDRVLDHAGNQGATVTADYTEYDFVATMRAIVWTIAGVVLGVGLLALTIATIDRTIQRRKEVAGLRLVGLAPGVLRRAQLIETGLPVTLGAVLAIGLGALAGATFLTLDDGLVMPWLQTWVLLGIAVLGCLGVAAIAMLNAVPRLRPEEIRAE
ncbi:MULTISPECIES: FtsX-like permease family protein [unclassified Nocardioides]|uniref:FtsX-like permease family protein n=1 Tax=unclassified Nocardioides TaxID=2615069 RepID=UPI00361D01D9